MPTKQSCLSIRRNIFGREDFSSVVVDVEARPVARVLPRLLTQLDGRADLLEVAGDRQHADHAENYTEKNSEIEITAELSLTFKL